MTHPAIELLKTKYKLPIDVATENGHQTSMIQVAQQVCDMEMTTEQYIDGIRELTFDAIDNQALRNTKHVARYTFRYVVNNLITSYLNVTPIDSRSIYDRALEKAKTYIEQNSWVFATGEDVNAPPKLDSNGNIAPKKGDKKVLAKAVWEKRKSETLSRKQWIEILVAEVGLTTNGASTYYHNLKTGIY